MHVTKTSPNGTTPLNGFYPGGVAGGGSGKPMNWPRHHTFSNRHKKRSLLLLPKWVLRRLARRGGVYDEYIDGFTLPSKSHYWPYPCVRPVLQTCWRYNLPVTDSYHAVAMHFRLLFAAIKWNEILVQSPVQSGKIFIPNDDTIVHRQIMDSKNTDPYGLSQMFLLRVVTISLVRCDRSAWEDERFGMRPRRSMLPEADYEDPTVELAWVGENVLTVDEIHSFLLLQEKKQFQKMKEERRLGHLLQELPEPPLEEKFALNPGMLQDIIRQSYNEVREPIAREKINHFQRYLISMHGFQSADPNVRLPEHITALPPPTVPVFAHHHPASPNFGKRPSKKQLKQQQQLQQAQQQLPTSSLATDSINASELMGREPGYTGPQAAGFPPGYHPGRAADSGTMTTFGSTPGEFVPYNPNIVPPGQQAQHAFVRTQMGTVMRVAPTHIEKLDAETIQLEKDVKLVVERMLALVEERVRRDNVEYRRARKKMKMDKSSRRKLLGLGYQAETPQEDALGYVELQEMANTRSVAAKLPNIIDVDDDFALEETVVTSNIDRYIEGKKSKKASRSASKQKKTKKRIRDDRDDSYHSSDADEDGPSSPSRKKTRLSADNPRSRPPAPTKIKKPTTLSRAISWQTSEEKKKAAKRRKRQEAKRRKSRHEDDSDEGIEEDDITLEDEEEEEELEVDVGQLNTPSTAAASTQQPSSSRRKSSSQHRKENRDESSAKDKQLSTSGRRREVSGQKGKKEKQVVDLTTVQCLCKKPYDPKKFMVGCDLCSNWFHGACVGISESKSKKMDEWACPDCLQAQKASQEELYCLCRTPYNDKLFYISCDQCQEWYHGSCVNISENEAGTLDEYTCPRCDGKEITMMSNQKLLDHRDIKELCELIRQLEMHRMSWPFLKPIDLTEFPNYLQVIKDPIDLSLVSWRLKKGRYERLQEFVNDVNRIFQNSREYNPQDSAIVNCANIVGNYFADAIRMIRERIEAELANEHN